VLMIAFLGSYVHKLVPNVMSFTDFVKRRFGPVVQIYVSLLMLFNSAPLPESKICPLVL
jgi:Na+/proline symporter